jgi:hypothetical protein
MTTRPAQPAVPGTQAATAAGQHLAAIATSLSGHGITSRLTRLGGTPVLTIDAPGAGEDPSTIAIDPDTHAGPGLRLDCTCTWTPALGATPQATAATITAILNALRPPPNSPEPARHAPPRR